MNANTITGTWLATSFQFKETVVKVEKLAKFMFACDGALNVIRYSDNIEIKDQFLNTWEIEGTSIVLLESNRIKWVIKTLTDKRMVLTNTQNSLLLNCIKIDYQLVLACSEDLNGQSILI